MSRTFNISLLFAVVVGLTSPAQARLPRALIDEAQGAGGLVLFGAVSRAWPQWVDIVRDGPSRAVGRPAFGRLDDGRKLVSSTAIHARSRDVWGTVETVAALTRGAQEIEALFPDRGPLVVTDISKRGGGHLRPHRTHQNGQDVDVLLYSMRSPGIKATRHGMEGARGPGDLDLERTLALLLTLRRADALEVVLLDRRLQRALFVYARDVVGLSEEVRAGLFEFPGGSRDALVRHAPKHATHMHLRFRSPAATAAADAWDRIRGLRRSEHIVGRGETLTSVASMYQTTVDLLCTENRLPVEARLRRGQHLFVLRLVPLEARLETSSDSLLEPRGG